MSNPNPPGHPEPDPYAELRAILHEAYAQSAQGKGKARHADGKAWVDQPINRIAAEEGVGFPAGQAKKKIGEAAGMVRRGELDAARAEYLGAINYAAACVRWVDQELRREVPEQGDEE